ncbi:hypothetical protein B0H14DRAFT_3025990 [Mycena olivaceomarginata]|nr:hypothetical protein B0H14DRAFT_3025990 [Mycena olivaceomarginata]
MVVACGAPCTVVVVRAACGVLAVVALRPRCCARRLRLVWWSPAAPRARLSWCWSPAASWLWLRCALAVVRVACGSYGGRLRRRVHGYRGAGRLRRPGCGCAAPSLLCASPTARDGGRLRRPIGGCGRLRLARWSPAAPRAWLSWCWSPAASSL